MTYKQIVDVASVGIDFFDCGTEFLFICRKSTALHHCDFQRVDSENLFEIFVVLIKIAEVYSELILEYTDTYRAVDEVVSLKFNIERCR